MKRIFMLLLLAGSAAAQTPTPTSCPGGQQVLLRWLNGQPSTYCGVAGTEAQAIATATATAAEHQAALADAQALISLLASNGADLSGQTAALLGQASVLEGAVISKSNVKALGGELETALHQIGASLAAIARLQEEQTRLLLCLGRIVGRAHGIEPAPKK